MKIKTVRDPIFLTAEEVPPNLLRLQPGDPVRWTRPPRLVTRVGYRKKADDYWEEADAILHTDEGREAARALNRLLGGRDPRTGRFGRVKDSEIIRLLARGLANKAGLGGPERGLHVDEDFLDDRQSWERDPEDPLFRERTTPTDVEHVEHTRVVRLGTYYAPSGSGENYEDGGLNNPRSVVLVRLRGWRSEVISGDLTRVPPRTTP